MKPTPLELVYEHLFKLIADELKRSVNIADGNLINLIKNPMLKDSVSPADLPELVLVPEAASPNTHASSSGSSMGLTWTAFISTGQLDAGLLLKVQWAIFVALHKFFVNPPKWNGKTFVKKADLPGLSAGRSNPDLNRGIKGWSATASFSMELYFATAEVIADGNA